MKVCLIGPGYKPIPPIGWGAVESVVWDYYVNLKHNNISVNIINNKNLQEVLMTLIVAIMILYTSCTMTT